VPDRGIDSGEPTQLDPDVIRLPFLVQDYFVPNGCFGDRDCSGGVITIDGRGCTSLPIKPQGACAAYAYTPLVEGDDGFKGYLGILFQDVGPEGESQIGKVPGRGVEPGATSVTFLAKVDAGPLDVSFRAGGANNWKGETDDTLPYRDEFGVELEVTLTNEYQRLTIPLSEVSYDTVVSPFGWSIESQGRVDPVQLFIAEVRWE
jgi:hypothetical protein